MLIIFLAPLVLILGYWFAVAVISVLSLVVAVVTAPDEKRGG